MATKENQAQQALVIFLVIMVLLLAGGLIWVNSNRKAAVARADQQTDRARDATDAVRKAQDEANTYKQWMGFQQSDNLSTLQTTFKNDMERFGQSFEEANRAYRPILESIYEENDKLSLSELTAKNEVKDLKERLLATEAEKEKQITEFRKQMQQAKEDAEAERSRFEQQYAQINEEKNKIAAQLDEQRQRFDTTVAENAQQQRELNDQISKLNRFNEVLKSDRKEVDRFAQPADGLVRWVNQRNGTVWINLGSADELRPQVTFSVYSSDEDDAKSAAQKGSIEVTRILSDHMAEARITADDSTDPILEGDKLYSQVWNRGRQVGFAVTGVVDLDGDTREDLDRLKSIIALNNGKVDATPGENGGIEGEMTIDTRYLILGEYPDDPHQDSLRRSWERMSQEADTLGIEPIALDDFLRLMGWRSERRTVPLGTGVRPADFTAETRDYQIPPTINPNADKFRPRKPRPTY